MDYYIITGTSRGIGEALATELLQPGNVIFASSRTLNEDLVEKASALQVQLFYFETDLSDPHETETFIQEVFDKIILTPGDRIALINNAGMIEPIGPLHTNNFIELEKHLHLNLLAPMILSSVFISRTMSYSIPKVILNISSGASYIPYYGWSAYCSSKAGMDAFTKVVGLEQFGTNNSVRIFALAPGIIDTHMQEQIRETNEVLFPDRGTFEKLHKEEKLSKPADVARIISMSLFSKKIGNGEILDIEKLRKMV